MGEDVGSFTFKHINMSQLHSTLKSIKAMSYASNDDISLMSIKQASYQLEPILLNIVNGVIITKEFPRSLKTTQIVPIRKKEKDSLSSNGWKLVNIVASMSKVIK